MQRYPDEERTDEVRRKCRRQSAAERMAGTLVRNGKRTFGFVVVLMVWVLAGATCGEGAYPTILRCTGSSVRVRAEPDRTSDILDKADVGDRFIALGETSVDGSVWYEVELSAAKGTGWLFGEYAEEYLEESERTPSVYAAVSTAIRISRSFGYTPERARALFGKPQKETKKKVYIEMAGEKLWDETLIYPTHEAHYLGGYLTSVRVREGTMPFGEIRIGDPAKKLVEVLGNPGDKTDANWSYELPTLEFLTFEVGNGRVAAMTYERAMD